MRVQFFSNSPQSFPIFGLAINPETLKKDIQPNFLQSLRILARIAFSVSPHSGGLFPTTDFFGENKMQRSFFLMACFSLALVVQSTGSLTAQDPAPAQSPTAGGQLEAGLESAQKSAAQVSEKISEGAQEIGDKLNQSSTVKEASASLLKPIYQLAQYMAHPWFYWIAFALMVAGVVSFAGQIVLTKLLLL